MRVLSNQGVSMKKSSPSRSCIAAVTSWDLDSGQSGKGCYLVRVALDKQQPQRLDGLSWSKAGATMST